MKQPFFILGNPRSGTTLLRVLINLHPNVIVPPECGFITWLFPQHKNYSFDETQTSTFLRDVQKSRKFETWNLDQQALFQFITKKEASDYSSLCSLVYEFYGQSKGKKIDFWGDKNNFYIKHIPTIKKIFPQGRFIHIIRDGRDVACSYRELSQKNIKSDYAPNLPTKIAAIAREWKENNEIIELETKGSDSLTIRYEDLVKNPASILTRLFNFLEAPTIKELNLIAFNQNLDEPLDFLQWKEKLKMPVNTDSIGRYERELQHEEITEFEIIAGEYLEKHSYGISK